MYYIGTAALLIAIPASLVTYLRRITPIFYDNFAIRGETIVVLFCLLFGIIAIIGFVSSAFFVTSGSVACLVIDMVGYFLWSTVYTLLIYISTIWVEKKNARWLRENSDSLAGLVAAKDDWDITDTFLRPSSGPADSM